MLEAGLERKVVQKSGSYFSFGDERLGQGRQNATAFLREHPDVTEGILAALQAQLGADQIVSARLLPAATDAERATARSSRRRRRREPDMHETRVVTALREARGGRVAVELDGAPWRVLPVDVAARAGLVVGTALDRERARTLARELRRGRALGTALGALRRRDLSRRALDERLARRGVREHEREEALGALERAGLVDDERVARQRAAALAERGWGDEAIRYRLVAEGVQRRDGRRGARRRRARDGRARPVSSRARGRGPETARWLARRGFGEDAVEEAAPGD